MKTTILPPEVSSRQPGKYRVDELPYGVFRGTVGDITGIFTRTPSGVTSLDPKDLISGGRAWNRDFDRLVEVTRWVEPVEFIYREVR
jgi:hypothetical protein